mmetsp:Transcript_99612/g.316201  ORF Transcript_99612/g.316201 Transcript_99612/m.316201 type:complete len:205 (+) Transcript_99612:64-678(+)
MSAPERPSASARSLHAITHCRPFSHALIAALQPTMFGQMRRPTMMPRRATARLHWLLLSQAEIAAEQWYTLTSIRLASMHLSTSVAVQTRPFLARPLSRTVVMHWASSILRELHTLRAGVTIRTTSRRSGASPSCSSSSISGRGAFPLPRCCRCLSMPARKGSGDQLATHRGPCAHAMLTTTRMQGSCHLRLERTRGGHGDGRP